MRFAVRTLARAAIAGTVAAVAIGAAAFRVDTGGPALAVREAGGWTTWWRGLDGPFRWLGTTPLADRLVWQPGAPGVEWGELQLRGSSEAWRTRVIVVRLDPARVGLSLVTAFTQNQGWTVADADSGAVVALDAGQFRHSLPWGWVVSDGRELLPPEYAPLAGAVVVDQAGAVRIVLPDSVSAERRRGTAQEAFQSYPMLLRDGVVPAPLREAGRGVDLTHRDTRLALGTTRDGQVIIALTRFDALGPLLGRVPFGLTTPEMAAVMGALGCSHALLLDGGISGQLMVRSANQSVRSWSGARRVPLGLVGRLPVVSPPRHARPYAAEGAVVGGIIGTSFLIPTAVHLANGSRGNLGRSMVVSALAGGEFGVGWAAESGELVLAAPVAQLISSLLGAVRVGNPFKPTFSAHSPTLSR